MSELLSDSERRDLDEAIGELGGAINAVGRARERLPRVRGTADNARRLRDIETALLAERVALAERRR